MAGKGIGSVPPKGNGDVVQICSKHAQEPVQQIEWYPSEAALHQRLHPLRHGRRVQEGVAVRVALRPLGRHPRAGVARATNVTPHSPEGRRPWLGLTTSGIKHFFGSGKVDLIDNEACHSMAFAASFDAASYLGHASTACSAFEEQDEPLLFDRLTGHDDRQARVRWSRRSSSGASPTRSSSSAPGRTSCSAPPSMFVLAARRRHARRSVRRTRGRSRSTRRWTPPTRRASSRSRAVERPSRVPRGTPRAPSSATSINVPKEAVGAPGDADRAAPRRRKPPRATATTLISTGTRSPPAAPMAAWSRTAMTRSSMSAAITRRSRCRSTTRAPTATTTRTARSASTRR